MPKTLYEEILEIENEIEELEEKKRSIETQISSERSKKSNAASRSAVGLGMMFQNPAAGYAIKSNADMQYLRNSSDILDLESELKKTDERIATLSARSRKMRKAWDESLKTAELVVEGDKLYIKGDPNKFDLLSSAKDIRGKKEAQLKGIYEDEVVSSYVEARKDYLKMLENSGLETYEEYNGRNSKYRKKADDIKYLTGTELFGELLGYRIPINFSFDNAIGSCEYYIREQEKRIERHKEEPELLKPTFMEKIFPKKFKERYTKAKNLSDYHIKDATEKIEKYKVAIEDIKYLKETVSDPYHKEIKETEMRYRAANEELLDADKSHLLSAARKLEETLNEHKCIKDIESIIPKEVEQYLIDNQLKLSIGEFKEKIASMDKLPEDIKLDIDVVAKESKEKEHRPKISRNNK
jgi:hypothetical protein